VLSRLSKEFGIRRHNNLGKKVGSKVWFLLDCIDEFDAPDVVGKVKNLKVDLCATQTVVRADLKSSEVVLIESSDFLSNHEPSVGTAYHFDENGYVSKTILPQKNTLIYHHKWLFVTSDYHGFDVNEAMKRSLLWKSKLGKNRALSSKIGRSEFWSKWLKENNING
tara:strand:+ start:2888 stop:3385 length:498 start_codon:yes stop_codon:yes gene_type:complete